MVIRAVVFDFDGLILDTETSIFRAWQECYAAHGAEPLSIDEWSAEIGTVRGLDLVGELRSRAGAVDDALLEARITRRDALLELEQVRPGIIDWLDAAEARGLRIAIASSSEPSWVEPHLVRLDLRQRFEAILCRTDSLPPKPAPDLYLAACAALDVDPAEALAVEDSPHGIAAAKGAGLRCVAVPNPITEHLDLSAADLVLDSLASMSLAAALASLV
jgi:HAD superfamily hydrolase (TIGR01509 family)